MDIQIPLTIKLSEDKQSKDAPWVAYTPELDIASCGPTQEKAKENLNEAVTIVLTGAAEDGNLRDIPVFIIENNLKTAGISRKRYFELLKKI